MSLAITYGTLIAWVSIAKYPSPDPSFVKLVKESHFLLQKRVKL